MPGKPSNRCSLFPIDSDFHCTIVEKKKVTSGDRTWAHENRHKYGESTEIGCKIGTDWVHVSSISKLGSFLRQAKLSNFDITGQLAAIISCCFDFVAFLETRLLWENAVCDHNAVPKTGGSFSGSIEMENEC